MSERGSTRRSERGSTRMNERGSTRMNEKGSPGTSEKGSSLGQLPTHDVVHMDVAMDVHDVVHIWMVQDVNSTGLQVHNTWTCTHLGSLIMVMLLLLLLLVLYTAPPQTVLLLTSCSSSSPSGLEHGWHSNGDDGNTHVANSTPPWSSSLPQSPLYLLP